MRLRSTVLVTVGLGLVIATAWQIHRLRPNSEPQGQSPLHLSPTNVGSRVVAEGRLMPYPGARVGVRTEVLGTITTMHVEEKGEVHQGDLMVELQADEIRAALEEAKARATEAKASLELAQSEQQRGERLREAAVSSLEEWDRVRNRVAVARAQLLAVEATENRLEALLAKTRIRAPIDGTVLIRHAHPGETVEPGALLVTIANLHRVRIEAEVDEFDTGRVAVGDPATVFAEAFPHRSWAGTVEEIPDHVMDRNLRPEDPGRPSDARVLVVKIALTDTTPLKLGQRVEVEIACSAGKSVRE